MNEDQIIELIDERIQAYFSQAPKGVKASNIQDQTSKSVFTKSVQIFDGKNIQLGRTNGTMIGTDSDQKLGFYGTTPIAKQTAISAPSGGSTTDSQARAVIVTIIAALKAVGITN